MTEPSVLEDVDTETMYQGMTPVGPRMPWDIGEPQPSLVALAESGDIQGEVLDVGSGLGDNAIYLTARGYRVTGIDEAPTAVEEARRRAAEKGLEINFEVADAMTLEGYENGFDTLLDSALYHNLTDDQRTAYVAALHRAGRPNARLHILSFSREMPDAFPECFRVTEENLRAVLGAFWKITLLERTTYTSSLSRDGLRRFVGLLSGEELDEQSALRLPVDEQERVKLPAWRVTAIRG